MLELLDELESKGSRYVAPPCSFLRPFQRRRYSKSTFPLSVCSLRSSADGDVAFVFDLGRGPRKKKGPRRRLNMLSFLNFLFLLLRRSVTLTIILRVGHASRLKNQARKSKE